MLRGRAAFELRDEVDGAHAGVARPLARMDAAAMASDLPLRQDQARFSQVDGA
jgi:hypothetical protein